MNDRSIVRRRALLIMLIVIAIFAGAGLVYLNVERINSIVLQFFTGIAFTFSLIGFVWVWFDPDSNAARQSDELLKLASQMLDFTKQGLTPEAAQHVCELLLPVTPAIAVAITDREVIFGYAGYNQENNQQGEPIRTTATHQTIEDGQARILYHADEIGLPASSARINGAIIEPLFIGQSIAGTLKFYYRRSSQISQTQRSVAHGFAELLSTQMAAAALDEQIKLTTSMELKALQAQINPHFLFNTLNTIASLIRTDPAKARVLLRDFSAFYRSTLEDSDDLIELEREITQVERYVSFEVARFGEDRLELVEDIDPYILDIRVPSFLIQPIVENCVRHAMRAEGKLVITITGTIDDDYVIICVSDNGIGMDEETVATMMEKESDTGLGIAVKNVRDRISGYFGPDSGMEVTSTLGVGTSIYFKLNRAIAEGDEDGFIETDDWDGTVIRITPNLEDELKSALSSEA